MNLTVPDWTAVATNGLVESLGWTLVHFVWQAAALALLTGLMLRSLRRASAVARYWVACGGLGLMAICPLITLGVLLANPAAPESAVVQLVTRDGMSERESGPMDGSPLPGDGMPLAEWLANAPATDSDPGPAASGTIAGQPDVSQPATTLALGPVFWEPVGQRIQSAAPWLVAIWICGVLVMSLRLMRGWLGLRRLTREGTVGADPALSRLVQQLSTRLGIGRPIRLVQSGSVTVPAVVGWLRPVILLPPSALSGLGHDDLSAILAHELAHVRRSDYLVNLIQSVLETVLFYHPAIWWLSARVRQERENCCDDLAARVCGGPRPYARALLQLEQLAPEGPTLALGAADGDLMSRISRLLGQTSMSSHRQPLWLAALGSLAVAGAVVSSLLVNHDLTAAHRTDEIVTTAGEQPQESDSPGAGTDPEAIVVEQDEVEDAGADQKSMHVLVLGPDGEPVEGVSVFASIWTRGDPALSPNQSLFTDAAGRATVEMPENFYIFRLWARAEGYVPLFANWEEAEIKVGDRPPEHFTFNLIRGVNLGGVIEDEDGDPVAGAMVEVMGKATHPNGERRPQFGTWYATGDEAVVTDDDGRWQLNNLPPANDLDVKVMVSHADYINDNAWGQSQKQQGVTTRQMLDGTAVLVVNKGVSVTGTITTPDGEIVDTGLVVWGDRPYWEKGTQEVRIMDGTYELPPLPAGQKRVTVMAPGWAPQTRLIDIHPMMEAVDFELEPGQRLSILVVDQDDNPIPGAWVGIQEWQGVESIYNYQHPNVIDSQIPFQADRAGLYRWTWAPDTEVTVSLAAEGHSHRRDIKLLPGDKVHRVLLNRAGAVSGDVFDSVTNRRIDDFRIFPVQVQRRADGSNTRLQRRSDFQPGRNGRFRISLEHFSTQQFMDYRLRIEAEGYAITESETFALNQVPDRLRFDLVPSPWITGRVIDESGNPVANAAVHVVNNNQNSRIDDYSSIAGSTTFSRFSDATGTFRIPPQDESCLLIVGHAGGYAETLCAAGASPGDIQLQPWAQVEGRIVDADGRPVAGQRVTAFPVRLFDSLRVYIQHLHTTETDGDGYYRLRQMPPQRFRVQTMPQSTGGTREIRSWPVNLEPGTTQTVDFGRGVLVEGQLSGSGVESGVAESTLQVRFLPIAPLPNGLPAGLTEPDDYDWRTGWDGYQQIQDQGDADKATQVLASIPSTTVVCAADGKFRVRLPQAGQYDVVVYLVGRNPDSPGVMTGVSGWRKNRMTISAPDSADEPIDIGQLEIPTLSVPDTGVELTDFELPTLDGKTVRLGELRGRTVLLDFWAPHCQSCQDDSNRLAEFARQRRPGNNLVIVSIASPGGGQGQPRRSQEDPGDDWLEARIESGTDFSQRYRDLGVFSLPRYLIVDPQGRLQYHGNLEGAIDSLNARRSEPGDGEPGG